MCAVEGDHPIDAIFPQEFRHLLNLGGSEFVHRLGHHALRSATLEILFGNNVRTQTEPMTRQRIAEISGALVTMYLKGCAEIDGFVARASELARTQIDNARSSDRASLWPALWLLGITGKSFQNVLRSDRSGFEEYVSNFEEALSNAAMSLETTIGPAKFDMRIERWALSTTLDWRSMLRLSTLLGCVELVIRGSDKSRYGKLFERLVLGSVLSSLGYTHCDVDNIPRAERVFWLSDYSGQRECDATAIVKAGFLARFDIGFIGIGNPEIVRDKLSRYARRAEKHGVDHSSITFIIVDRYPTGPRSSSEELAAISESELIQMSMSYWPQVLSRRIAERFKVPDVLEGLSDSEVEEHLRKSVASLDLFAFLSGVELNEDAESD